MWLREMFPELDKYQLAVKAKQLKREGWEVGQRWDYENKRTKSWAEPPQGYEPTKPVPESNTMIETSALESALSQFFEELLQLRQQVTHLGKEREASQEQIVNLEKKYKETLERQAFLQNENNILKDENTKLRTYGLTTLPATPTLRKIMEEYKRRD